MKYDAADNARKSYDVAIDDMRERLASFRCERIGPHTLYLGDCREILPLLGKVDAVMTDPPYGIGLKKKTNDYRGSKFFDFGESLRASQIYDDNPEDIRQLIRDVIPMALAQAERGLVFCGTTMIREYPEPASIGSIFTMAGAGRTAWGFQCTHPVLFYGKDPFLQDGLGGRPNSLNDNQPNGEKIDHPCPKPIAWMKWAVNRASRVSETILDPFMGSGTTGVACVKLGRKFIGIEIEPKYFEIACKRIDEAMKQPDLFVASPEPKPEQLSLIGDDT